MTGELNLSAFDYVLKYQMLGPIQQQFAENIAFLQRIKRSSDNVDGSGRKILMPVLLNTGQSVGARADGGALPTANAATYYESQANVRHNYATLEVTGPTIRASRKSSSAFAKAVTAEMDNKTLALKQDVSRQMWGYGLGIMCQANGVAVGQTLVVDTPGTQYLKVGMVLDTYTGTTVNATSLTITAINDDTGVITCTGTMSGILNNDYIVRHGAYGIEMMGLAGICDNDTLLSSLQSIDSGDYPIWRGKVFDNPLGTGGTNRTLSLALMQSAYSYCEKAMQKPSIILTSFNLRDKYVQLLSASKRYVNTMKLDGGFEAVEFNGTPLLPMPDAPPSSMWFLQESMLQIAQISDLAWADEDGTVLHKIAGYDMYEADLFWDAELCTKRRNVHAVITDITES